MGIITGFMPFLLFALILHLGHAELALWAAAILSALLITRDMLARRRAPRLLELGSLALFLALAVYTRLAVPGWTIPQVRLVIDGGLLAIVILSVAIGRPFTLQYAREGAPQSIWQSPRFLAVNRRISLAWAAAFLVMVAADAAMIWLPQVPDRIDIVATIIAMAAAVHYTKSAAAHAAR